MNKLVEGKRVFDVEIRALQMIRDSLDNTFINIINLITNCSGKVILTGMGKAGHIAKKISATFSSLGTPSFYLHPAEAMHGDLGMISQNDILIAISYSGESNEIVNILPSIKMIGVPLVAITGNPNSSLAEAADIVQAFPEFEEACYLGLAPTSSSTSALVYGDALAVVTSEIYNFTNSDFMMFHPAGALGKKLILKVDDLMAKDAALPVAALGTSLVTAIEVMSKKGLGIISIIDRQGSLCGIITDGDLRRIFEKKVDIYTICVDQVMTKRPITVKKDVLAVDALVLIRDKRINALPVVTSNHKLIGMLTWQQIVRAGIVV